MARNRACEPTYATVVVASLLLNKMRVVEYRRWLMPSCSRKRQGHLDGNFANLSQLAGPAADICIIKTSQPFQLLDAIHLIIT